MKEATQTPPKWMYVLPNLFTLGSLFAGFYAITLAASMDAGSNSILYAAIAILAGAMCDMMDGRVARMTQTQSEFGLHMDSLVDLVTFGIAPAMLVYKWAFPEWGVVGMLVAFAFAACGACRLARFNVIELSQKEQDHSPGASRYFVGLPIPLAAGMLISVIVLLESMAMPMGLSVKLGMAGITMLLAVLMVSQVRFRTFKDLRFNGQTLAVLGLLLIILASSVVLFPYPALALVLMYASYIFVGLLGELFGVCHRLISAARATSK